MFNRPNLPAQNYPTHMTGTGGMIYSSGTTSPGTSVYSSGPTWQNGIGQTGTSTGMPTNTSVYSSGPTWQNGIGQTGTSTGMPSGNAYGYNFRQEYGQAPGQMRDEWAAYRQAAGIGGGQPGTQAPLPGAPPLTPDAPNAAAPTAFPGLQRLPDDLAQQARQRMVSNVAARWMPQGLLG